jgi:hypothetical protein
MDTQVKKNIIIINGKEISWDYTICPCLACQLYLKDNKSPENKICESSHCTYNRQLAKNIANDIFFIMNNKHCGNCDTWHPKEDLRHSNICPNCGYDLN